MLFSLSPFRSPPWNTSPVNHLSRPPAPQKCRTCIVAQLVGGRAPNFSRRVAFPRVGPGRRGEAWRDRHRSCRHFSPAAMAAYAVAIVAEACEQRRPGLGIR
jgi:hypothetical protein